MATTLALLVTGAKTAANAQVDGAWSSTEWDAAMNRALEALWVDALAINPTLRVSSTTLTVSATATPSASLPADFMGAVRVLKNAGTSNQQEVFRSGTEPEGYDAISYRLEGSTFYVDPFERSVGVYTLKYNPLPTALTGAVDLDAELSQHREYLQLHAAIQYMGANQESITDLAPMFSICKGRVETWAARQRSSQPARIKDVRPRFTRLRWY